MFFRLNTCIHSPYVTSSLAIGWVCRLQMLLVLASAVILKSESHGTHDHILLSQIPDSPNLEDQVPVFISPRNRVLQIYPQPLRSLFVAPYVSQGYRGAIRPRLHTRSPCPVPRTLGFKWFTDRIEDTVSDSSFIVECMLTARLYVEPFQ
jgi:hypothetical protein